MRYLIAIAVSCVVVFFLFLGMNKLITPDHRELVEKDDVTMTDFIRLKPNHAAASASRAARAAAARATASAAASR